MKIDIKILKKIIDSVFKHLDDLDLKKIEIKEDFYWEIDQKEKYNPYENPEKFDLGQLEDDWNELKKIAKHEIIHILIGRLTCLSDKKYITDDERYEAVEELVVKLEKLL